MRCRCLLSFAFCSAVESSLSEGASSVDGSADGEVWAGPSDCASGVDWSVDESGSELLLVSGVSWVDGCGVDGARKYGVIGFRLASSGV